MIPGKSPKKRPIKLFVMNAKVLKKKQKKPRAFSPFTWERAIRLAMVVAVLATCGFGGFKVGRYFLTDPKHAVKHIVVNGNAKFSDEKIINISGLRKGENIFRARIYRARNRLSELPLIEHVSVSRLMPDTIAIEVVERRPRAKLSGRKKLLADYSGVVLPSSCHPDSAELPLIVGVETADLSVGDRCSQPAMTAAMWVLELCQSSPLSDMVDVGGIDSSRADDVRLYLKGGKYTREACEVLVGGGDFGQNLAKLAKVLQSVLEEHRRKIARVGDLTLDNVPVRFR